MCTSRRTLPSDARMPVSVIRQAVCLRLEGYIEDSLTLWAGLDVLKGTSQPNIAALRWKTNRREANTLFLCTIMMIAFLDVKWIGLAVAAQALPFEPSFSWLSLIP